jgi:outer membrane protein, heavy metal efflux system
MRLSGLLSKTHLILLAGAILSAAVPTVSANQPATTGSTRDLSLLAAGQIVPPSSTAPTTAQPPLAPLKNVLRPAALGKQMESAPISLYDLFPPAKESAAPPPVASDAVRTGLPVQINLEYDESLAPASNMPGTSVVEALNEALVKGPRAAALRAQFGISRSTLAAATQAANPVFFYDRGLMAEQVNRMGPVLAPEPPWKLIFRWLAASRLVAQTKIDLLAQIWLLRADVRRAYVELVVAQETQRTLEQLYDLSSKLLTVTEKRFKAGAVPQLDVLKARLAASQAAVDLSVGKRRVLRAKQQLNILMGKTSDAALSVPALPDYTSETAREILKAQKSDILPDFARPVPPLQAFIERALQNRLELKSLDQQIRVNQSRLQGACANIIKDPSIAFGKSTAGNPPSGPKTNAVFFTLNAELPVSNLNQGAIWQYRATARQLHYQIAAQQNMVTADVTAAYNNLLATRKKLRVYQDKLLTDSNTVARLSRRSYEVGQSDITAALTAQQANIQTRYAYLDAVNAYGTAFTDLEFAVGKPLQ